MNSLHFCAVAFFIAPKDSHCLTQKKTAEEKIIILSLSCIASQRSSVLGTEIQGNWRKFLHLFTYFFQFYCCYMEIYMEIINHKKVLIGLRWNRGVGVGGCYKNNFLFIKAQHILSASPCRLTHSIDIKCPWNKSHYNSYKQTFLHFLLIYLNTY